MNSFLRWMGSFCWCLALAVTPVVGQDATGDKAEAPAEAEDQVGVEVVRDGDLYSLSAQDAPLTDILKALRAKSEVELKVDPALLGERFTLDIREASYEEIVKSLTGSHAMVYEKTEDGGYRLVAAWLTSQQPFVPPPLSDLPRRERRNVEALSERTQQLLAEHRQIISYAGELDYDQAKALIQARKAQVQTLVDQLAAMGPGGARAMLGAMGPETETREKLAVIEALSRIEDAEAVPVLGQLFAEQKEYSIQREVIGALGKRQGPEADAMLPGILNSTPDKRLRAATVQAMSGRSGLLPQLTALVESDGEFQDVRSEAIRSIGLVGTDEARQALSQTSIGSANPTVRKAAIQELARSFGDGALPMLESLLSDPNEGVRNNAVKAISRISSPAATDLLKRAAESDGSDVVRRQAAAALARATNSNAVAN